MDSLQDYASSIHPGLTEIGGLRRYNELTARQNRYMYRQEQANLVAFNVMGGDRYLRMASQAAVGVHQRADATDERAVATQSGDEEGEDSDMSVDESVEDPNTREHLLQRLRDLLNEALAYEEYRDGASIQHCEVPEGSGADTL